MTLVRWISRLFGWLKPAALPVHRVHRNGSKRRSVIRVAAWIVGLLCSSLPIAAWSDSPIETNLLAESAALPVPKGKPRQIVAAGVGFQNDETSSITVKTYDAESGVTLSEDTYELNVKDEEKPGTGNARERIFAGGVGTGANGLAEFTLRVYDATTGRFLWEGVLNLSPAEESGSPHQVVARVSPKPMLSMIRRQLVADGQPEFLLRAVDPVTGKLVWADQFSAGAARLARAERVSRSVFGKTEFTAGPSRDIEFRIRMLDDQEREVIWEDQLAPTVMEAETVPGQDHHAETIPEWHSTERDTTAKAGI